MTTKLNIQTSLLVGSVALLATLGTLPAHAAGLTYATKVDSYTKGTGSVNGQIADDRDNPEEALGALSATYNPGNNNKFLSLGVGGQATFSFGTLFRNQVKLWETTWGTYTQQSGYDEQVDVYAQTQSGSWDFISRVKNIADGAYKKDGASITLAAGKVYQALRLVDKSATGSGRDGWDVAAIAVEAVPSQAAAVPEPTTMTGLALAGSGLLAARRRRAARPPA